MLFPFYIECATQKVVTILNHVSCFANKADEPIAAKEPTTKANEPFTAREPTVKTERAARAAFGGCVTLSATFRANREVTP